jgi:hypothetical protein
LLASLARADGLAAAAMLVPTLCLSSDNDCFLPVLGSFMLVEFAVGSFMPAAAKMRSTYVPDNLQGAILNIFRLPLNFFVVVGTKMSDSWSTVWVYRAVCAWFFAAALLQYTLVGGSEAAGKKKPEKKVAAKKAAVKTTPAKPRGRSKSPAPAKSTKSPARAKSTKSPARTKTPARSKSPAPTKFSPRATRSSRKPKRS